MARPVIVRVGAVKLKMIVIWSGSIATIPTGYQLCDGTNGTPNLIDYFIAADNYGHNGYGQAIRNRSHRHSLSTAHVGTPAHTHTTIALATDTAYQTSTAGGAGTNRSYGHTHTYPATVTDVDAHTHELANTDYSTDTAVEGRPPFYALTYIAGNTDVTDVPIGGIIFYGGNIAALPSAWALCNGTNGTPDLTTLGRLVVGAGNTYAVGDQGGDYYFDDTNLLHTHVNLYCDSENAHTHTTSGGGSYPHTDYAGSGTAGSAGSNTDRGSHMHFSVGSAPMVTGVPSGAHWHTWDTSSTMFNDEDTMPPFKYLVFVQRII